MWHGAAGVLVFVAKLDKASGLLKFSELLRSHGEIAALAERAVTLAGE